MTIPTLINKYQKIQYVTQLKKTYSTLQNGFKLMIAREGVSYLTDTDEWKNLNSGYGEYLTDNVRVINLFKKNFNVVDVRSQDNYKVKDLYSSDGKPSESFVLYNRNINFSDGSLLVGVIYNPPLTKEDISDIKK